MIFFNAHIGRTAGTTLGYVLRRNYGDEFLKLGSREITKCYSKERTFPVTPMLNNYELSYIIDQCDKLPKVISSHYLPIPEATEVLKEHFTNVKLMTFLREPTARVISHYFMFRKKRLLENAPPEHIKYDYRHDMKNFFRNYEYVASKFPVRNATENHQTFSIDNTLNLDQAISRLRNDFWFVGIVERFDEGLLLLKDQFNKLGKNFDIMYIRQQVVSRTTEEKEQLVTDAVRETIKDLNKLDVQLYEAAKQIFEERIKSYSGDLESDLYKYRKKLQRWQLYQKYMPYKAKKILSWTWNKFTIGHK